MHPYAKKRYFQVEKIEKTVFFFLSVSDLNAFVSIHTTTGVIRQPGARTVYLRERAHEGRAARRADVSQIV